MILVNGSWEIVEDLKDVSKIIREYYNEELADKLDYLLPEHTDEEYYDLNCNYNDTIELLIHRIKRLGKMISDLEDEIEELKNM